MIRSMMGRKKVDKNTLLLLHFDGSLKDEASGKPYVGSNMSYVVGKFKNCVSFSGNGYVKISGTNAINESLCPNYTVDFWIKLKSGVRNGIMSKGDGGGSYSFDILWIAVWWNPRGCNMLFYDATGSVGSSCDRQVTISILESVCKWSVCVWFHINDGFRVL